MIYPVAVPEAVEACADWSHPLPHPDTILLAPHSPVATHHGAITMHNEPERVCWPCFAVWASAALGWVAFVIAVIY